jgi:uncharacterized phage protein (TIGR01671 family)
MVRELKFKFVIEKDKDLFLTKEYILDENGIPHRDTILEEMEECTCMLTESQAYCDGSCMQFQNAKVIDTIQFTGLKDKNDKDIFQGDIVQNENSDIIGIVKWVDDSEKIKEHAMFGIWDFLNKQWYWFADHYPPNELIVVGNEYQNKELLGENHNG